jgi:hypothetical protein
VIKTIPHETSNQERTEITNGLYRTRTITPVLRFTMSLVVTFTTPILRFCKNGTVFVKRIQFGTLKIIVRHQHNSWLRPFPRSQTHCQFSYLRALGPPPTSGYINRKQCSGIDDVRARPPQLGIYKRFSNQPVETLFRVDKVESPPWLSSPNATRTSFQLVGLPVHSPVNCVLFFRLA